MEADLVLEGSGDRGIAIVGALSLLEESGYQFHRIAGTSAGALVGALFAAGYNTDDLREILRTLDHRRFHDTRPFKPLGWFGAARLVKRGLYRGDYARNWLAELLAEQGVQTFADLSYSDPFATAPERRFRLVVLTSDLTAGALRRLPWDYGRYGMDGAGLSVADAVRASAAMPLYYPPVYLDDQVTGERSVLVDGTLLSDFPIGMFDTVNRLPRWPTLGVKLATSSRSQAGFLHESSGPLVVAGLLAGASDRIHFADPWALARTIFVDTLGVPPNAPDLDAATSQRLYDSGRQAADAFLSRFDMNEYRDLTRQRAKTANTGAESGNQPDRSDQSAVSEPAGDDEQPAFRASPPMNEKQEREALRAINPSLDAFYGDEL
jgi:NTE family protein